MSNYKALCIVFEGRDLYVKEIEGNTRLLTMDEAESLGVDISNLLLVGEVDNIKYYAGKVEKLTLVNSINVLPIVEVYETYDDNIFSLIMKALHLLKWWQNNKYCSKCGSNIDYNKNNGKISCVNCAYSSYPSISPVILVAVVKGDLLLLARGKNYPPDFYSLISGFVDPGESLEECVRRELKEEVGIEVNSIEYFASQPWPFSSSLLTAFRAEYSSGDIEIDENELADAAWYPLNDLPNIPSKLSIARRLIDSIVMNYSKEDTND